MVDEKDNGVHGDSQRGAAPIAPTFFSRASQWLGRRGCAGKGMVVSTAVYLALSVPLAVFLLADRVGLTREGYEAAGLTWILLGLPLSLLAQVLEDLGVSPDAELVSLFFLGWLNWICFGAGLGWLLGRLARRRRSSASPT